MIEMLIGLNSDGFIDNGDDKPVYIDDPTFMDWLNGYTQERRIVMGSVAAQIMGPIDGALLTYTLTASKAVKGTMPISVEQMVNLSNLSGIGFTVMGGKRTFTSMLPHADIITLAFTNANSGRGKILLPELPLYGVKWFPEVTEDGLWLFRGLSDRLCDKEGVSSNGAIELPSENSVTPDYNSLNMDMLMSLASEAHR